MSNYSGKFVLRTEPDLHETLANKARESGLSLNRYCNMMLSGPTTDNEFPWKKIAKAILPKLKNRFGEQLVGVAAFGSQVSRKATDHSDVDILVVLSPDTPIKRSLYGLWEQFQFEVKPELSPHFVNFSRIVKQRKGSGFWLEIALNHKILFEKKGELTKRFNSLQKTIARDEVRRYFSGGHPFWVWRKET
jgi:predicted nucleotidyltransferase